MYIGMQYQTKSTKQVSAPAPATQQKQVNLLNSQPRIFGKNMIDAIKKTSKGCKSCGS